MSAPVEAETTKAGPGGKGKSTSKSPARGGSPNKGPEKQQSMVQKEPLQDFEVAAKDLEKAELKKYGVSA